VRFRAPILSACCAGVLAAAIPAYAQAVVAPATVSEVSLPGGLPAALAALGDPVAADRSQFLIEFVRRFYNIPIITRADERAAVLRALTAALDNPAAAASTDTIPLPLTADIWVNTIFAGHVSEHGLVSAIAQSRDASLLYYGLLSLDDATRAWLSDHRQVLAEVAQHAPPFAAAAPGFRVANDVVVLPGGDAATPLWEGIVGRPTHTPDAFLRSLLTEGNGRLAYFLGAIAGLGTPQIEIALTPSGLDGPARVEAARRLYGVFERLSPGWRIGERIFQRPPLDPALLAADLRLDRSGRASLPGSRRFWSAVFAAPFGRGKSAREEEAAMADEAPVDFAWLCEQIFAGDPAEQRLRYNSVLLASRTIDRVTTANLHDAIDAVRGMIHYPALVATLERAQVTDVAVIGSAVRRAEQLSSMGYDHRSKRAVAQYQGALAILTRATLRGSIDPMTLATAVAGLSAIDPDERGDYAGRVIEFLDTRLRELPTPGFDAAAGLSDRNVLGLIAGPVVAQPPTIDWEGTRYRVDHTKSETLRLEQLIGDAPPAYLSSASALVGIAKTLTGGGLATDAVRAQVAALHRAAHQADLDVDDTWSGSDVRERYLQVDGKLARIAQSGNAREAARWAADIRLLADDLAARGLMELTYAAAMGQRDRTSIMADDAARRHEFGSGVAAAHRVNAWAFPTAGTNAGGWRVTGSLLGLDVALAEFSLLPLSSKIPPRRPTLADDERQVMIDGVALVTPSALTDADRDTIAAALQRGRGRVAETRTPDDAVGLASSIRISPLRRTLFAWLVRHDPSRAASFFSPLELFWLGRTSPRDLHAWGAPAESRTGCQCLDLMEPRPLEELAGRWGTGAMMSGFPDLNLRLAELLTELHMPASLLAPVLASASLDFVNSVVTRDQDDWRGLGEFVRSLRADRLELYLALLTTGGPLAPLDGPDTADKERHR
jgi:hypothetical protein